MSRIVSNFKRGTEDWTIAGDVNVFEWRQTDDAPNGYLFWDDAAVGNVAFWQAPADFLGNLRVFVGGRLSFDWFSSGGSVFADGDVRITGGNGVTLVGDVTNPGTDWSSAGIRFSPKGDWHIETMDGALATRKQIAAVLRDVAQFEVRAEHVNGDETGGLDNVVLQSRRDAPSTNELSAAFGSDAGATVQSAPAHWHAPDLAVLTLV